MVVVVAYCVVEKVAIEMVVVGKEKFAYLVFQLSGEVVGGSSVARLLNNLRSLLQVAL